MIISVAELKQRINCGTDTDEQITAKLEAIEAVIRSYTNNNFQQRGVRFVGRSEGKKLYGSPESINVDDTVQISASQANDGLYVVVKVNQSYIEVNEVLAIEDENLVTKVKYPPDVIQCAIDLYKWKQNMGEKVGIKSETISRHSVTYEDSTSLFMGYPMGIMKGLTLHKKARC